MEMFFDDPNDPRMLPQEVRIRTQGYTQGYALRAEPFPVRQRVRVVLGLTPFLKRPSSEIYIYAAGGQIITNTSIIETMLPKMQLTLYLKGAITLGRYIVKARVFFPHESEAQTQEMQVEEQRLVVDEGETSFEVWSCLWRRTPNRTIF